MSTPLHRPVPDDTPVRRALRVLEAGETDMERYVRDEHSAMISAARVGMDSARHLWPVDHDHIPVEARGVIVDVKELFEQAYKKLDVVSRYFHGTLVNRALLGENIDSALEEHEKAAGLEWPPPQAPAAAVAPPIDQASHDAADDNG